MSDKFIWATPYSARTKRIWRVVGRGPARGSERRHVTPRDKIAGNSGAPSPNAVSCVLEV